MSEDTPDCIAHEMMEDLSLSAHEACVIAEQIKHEIGRIAGQYVSNAPLSAAAGSSGNPESGAQGADAGAVPARDLLAAQEAAVANAAAAAVAAVASASAAVNTSAAAGGDAGMVGSGGVGDGGTKQLPSLARPGQAPPASSGQVLSTSQAPPQAGGAGASAGVDPPAQGSSRPTPLHEIVRAMQEFNAQQLEEQRQQQEQHQSEGCPRAAGEGLGARPVEVVLPAGHALDTAALTRVASAAASSAVQQLAEATASLQPANEP